MARLCALTLALLLTVSLAAPALAAGDETVPWSNLRFGERLSTSGDRTLNTLTALPDGRLLALSRESSPDTGKSSSVLRTCTVGPDGLTMGDVLFESSDWGLYDIYSFRGMVYSTAFSLPDFDTFALLCIDLASGEAESVLAINDRTRVLGVTESGLYLSVAQQTEKPYYDDIYRIDTDGAPHLERHILNAGLTASMPPLPGERGLYLAGLTTESYQEQNGYESCSFINIYPSAAALPELLDFTAPGGVYSDSYPAPLYEDRLMFPRTAEMTEYIAPSTSLIREAEDHLYVWGSHRVRDSASDSWKIIGGSDCSPVLRVDLRDGSVTDLTAAFWDSSVHGGSNFLAMDFGPGCVYILAPLLDSATFQLWRVDEQDGSARLMGQTELGAPMKEGSDGYSHPDVLLYLQLYAVDGEHFLIGYSRLSDAGTFRWAVISAES